LIIQALIATIVAVPFFFRQQIGRALRSIRHHPDPEASIDLGTTAPERDA
jgi:hypothetical protein